MSAASAPRCVCGAVMRLVPVHHKSPRHTTRWPVCETCNPGQPARPQAVDTVVAEPRLTIVRTSA